TNSSTKDTTTTKSSVAKRAQELHKEKFHEKKVIEEISTGSIAVSIMKKQQAGEKIDPPSLRFKAILPIQALLQNPGSPYYPDALEKYFQRPRGQEFDNIFYEEYYQKYNICVHQIHDLRITQQEI
ncbi:11005_t:CDS:2, partial [Paraglomus brasilianum]